MQMVLLILLRKPRLKNYQSVLTTKLMKLQSKIRKYYERPVQLIKVMIQIVGCHLKLWVR